MLHLIPEKNMLYIFFKEIVSVSSDAEAEMSLGRYSSITGGFVVDIILCMHHIQVSGLVRIDRCGDASFYRIMKVW
jgi:hypothetical protein